MTKQSVAANNAALVLTALGTSEMTQCEIGAAANMSRPRVSAALAYLTTIKRIHISQWRLQGKYFVRMFIAGAGDDAVKPIVGKAAQAREKLCCEILIALRVEDMTARSLVEATQSTMPLMRLALRSLHNSQRIHVARYTGETRSQRIYRAGMGMDATETAAHRKRKISTAGAPPPDPLMAALFGR